MDRLQRGARPPPGPMVVVRAKRDGVSNCTAAMAIGVERVGEGQARARGLFP